MSHKLSTYLLEKSVGKGHGPEYGKKGLVEENSTERIERVRNTKRILILCISSFA